jgi:hypothetical protein
VVAFLSTVLVFILLLVPVVVLAKRRPVGRPITWGEAMAAGVYVFFILFWSYGVLPHQFLTWADSELNWRPDRIWFGPGGSVTVPLTGWVWETPWFPITTSAQVFRDIVVTLIYVGLLGFQIFMWAWWQNRGKRAEVTEAIEPVTQFGRPLIKRA